MLGAYLDAMPKLEAEQQLARIEAAGLPHMDKSSRDNVFRRLRGALGRSAKPKPATPADLAMLGIRVEQPHD